MISFITVTAILSTVDVIAMETLFVQDGEAKALLLVDAGIASYLEHGIKQIQNLQLMLEESECFVNVIVMEGTHVRGIEL